MSSDLFEDPEFIAWREKVAAARAEKEAEEKRLREDEEWRREFEAYAHRRRTRMWVVGISAAILPGFIMSFWLRRNLPYLVEAMADLYRVLGLLWYFLVALFGIAQVVDRLRRR